MKKIILLLTLIILTASIFITISNVTAVDNCYNAGANPIPICTCDDLNKTSLLVSSNYQIQNNIDCSGYNFDPIGDSSNRYSGTFDGQNYNITNLQISKAENYIGLFSMIQGGRVSNVNIINGNISGTQYVGGLVGYTSNSNITHCSFSGNVNGSSTIGGLVGKFYDYVKINSSTTSGTVSSSGNYIGGLVGYGSPNIGGSSVKYSSSNANVSGAVYVGGLIGSFGCNSGGWTIINCYAT